MMKVQKAPEYVVDSEDVEMVYHGIHCYLDSLEKYASWIDDTDLDGKDSAIVNIKEEIAEYRKLSLDIYMKCFSANIAKHTERTRKYAGDYGKMEIYGGKTKGEVEAALGEMG